MWQVHFVDRPFSTFALKNLIFEIRHVFFIENTLEQKDEKQYSTWMPPPPDVGVLKASPPRNMASMLERPFPAQIRRHWPLQIHQG
jgi:hypothetical protein